jgi:hypothetical protein
MKFISLEWGGNYIESFRCASLMFYMICFLTENYRFRNLILGISLGNM